MNAPGMQESSALEALSVALQHPAVATDQQNICRLLQVCKAWRACVQQSAAGLTILEALSDAELKDLPKLADIAAWISKYPSLLHSISLNRRVSGWEHAKHSASMAARFLELGIQLAAAGGASGAALQTAGIPTTTATKQRWGLQSYRSNLGVAPAVLSALPAPSLTELRLHQLAPTSLTAVVTHVQRLTNLCELSIRGYTYTPESCSRLLSALAPLQNLVDLGLGRVEPSHLQQLPLQLTGLQVDVDSGVINLEHLTSLQVLHLTAGYVDEPGSALPTQLMVLYLKADDDAPIAPLGITNLQNLQMLDIGSYIEDAQELLSLTTMQQLEVLHLGNQMADQNGVAGPVWAELTILKSLGVVCSSDDLDILRAQWEGAGQAGGITRLIMDLEYEGPPDGDSDDEEVSMLSMCESFTALKQLEMLTLDVKTSAGTGDIVYGRLVDHDALHLTALTGLRDLCLDVLGGVDDTVVCALATTLTQLDCLLLPQAVLSTAPLPAIGSLTNLEQLELRNYKKADAQFGLQFLTGLNQLTQLDGFDSAGRHALDGFWSSVRSGR